MQRIAAFEQATSDLGLEGEVVETDYSVEQGARATRKLLSSPEPPTRDRLRQRPARGHRASASRSRWASRVPDDLSIVGWDDSLISQVVHPPLTAITRDIEAFGIAAARHLLAAIEGEATGDVETVRGELTPRGSTARAARAVALSAISGVGSREIPLDT